MICPDCGKEIGRFAAATDDGKADLATITCPRTGRKVLPERGPEPKTVGNSKARKAWKRKKNAQKTRELVEV